MTDEAAAGADVFMMDVIDIQHSGIWEELILLTIGRPASFDAGIRGKPLGGFYPTSLSLVPT